MRVYYLCCKSYDLSQLASPDLDSSVLELHNYVLTHPDTGFLIFNLVCVISISLAGNYQQGVSFRNKKV